jgi:hypothetical protein
VLERSGLAPILILRREQNNPDASRQRHAFKRLVGKVGDCLFDLNAVQL